MEELLRSWLTQAAQHQFFHDYQRRIPMRGRMKGALHFVLVMLLACIASKAQTGLASLDVAGTHTTYLFYLKNSHVYTYYSSNINLPNEVPSWNNQDITAASNGASASGTALANFYRDANYPEHVFFVDGNGHVHELWSDSNTVWHDSDLTASSGGAPARNAALTGFYRDANYPEHAFFEDGNGHIHELWSDSTAAWHDSDLTASASGTVAVAGSALSSFYWPGINPEHVFFQDGKNHIHELWSDSTAAWHDHDLTQISGSGALSYPGNGLTSFYEGGNYPEHVIYQNGTTANPNGGTINEMWLDSAGWHDHNLTGLTNAPILSTETAVSGFSTTDSYPEHAFYVDSQGSVHEMFLDSSSTWHDHIVFQGSLSGLYALPEMTGPSAASSSAESVFYFQEYHPQSLLSLGYAYSSSGIWESFGLTY